MSNLSEENELYEDVSNPLDSVEEILYANDWTFERPADDELTVQVSGKMGEYTLFFQWHEDYSAMQFSCQFDMNVKKDAVDRAAKMMTTINSGLWLGHFDFREGTNTPCFRHTTLFRGMTQTSGAAHIEDLVDIALAECERFYTAFDLLARGTERNEADLDLALMPAVGEA